MIIAFHGDQGAVDRRGDARRDEQDLRGQAIEAKEPDKGERQQRTDQQTRGGSQVNIAVTQPELAF